MGILEANTYHPNVMARTYKVVFLSKKSEDNWAELVHLRNEEFARYLTPPNTSAGISQWDWSIKTGQMADTIEQLNEKWHRIISEFISTAVEANAANVAK